MKRRPAKRTRRLPDDNLPLTSAPDATQADDSMKRLLIPALFSLLVSCADRRHHIIVSVAEQRMAVLDRGTPKAWYPVSTSKFGLGESRYCTPLGRHRIRKKIGGGHPSGMCFKGRKPTGEIVPVNAPGRDPIVTRILWLDGLEPHNSRTYSRYVYIHGTPEEWRIGTPASYGCVRMKSRDVIELYNTVGRGAIVDILQGPLPPSAAPPAPVLPVPPPAYASGY